MTKIHRSKVGPKGQVVVAKELREKYGIKEGKLVEQISTNKGVLLVPLSTDDLLRELDDAAEEIGKAWPKGVSAAEAIREDREKQWLKK
jgi:AbrB family looped-hinge helix DNA binding protein